jgi:hypothetical protein
VLTQRPQEPGFAHQNEHVAQYKFEREPQEKHQKSWANFELKSSQIYSNPGRLWWLTHKLDVLIPPSAGLGTTKRYYQRRTMFQYSILFTLGLWCFQNLRSTALRAVTLGMLFPGAGLVAVCTIPSLLAFVVTLIGIPVTLFVWFAMGGVLFPLLLWFVSAGLAGILAKDTLVDKAGPAWGVACVFIVTWAIWKSSQINARGKSIQLHRNKWIPNEVKALQDNAVPAPAPGSRELYLKTLRFLQHMIERGLTKHDDLSYHDVIDQFRTGAVRYQLYGVVDSIALYLTHYAPGFHGYAAEACRNCMEKSLTKKIMSYWKWERLTGKLTTDYDPINYDQIMVTGYLGVAIGLYASATGDRRYEEKGCLDFHIADGIHFKRSFGDLADAMYQNMATNDYCLYPYEPNWTYSLCKYVTTSHSPTWAATDFFSA